MRCWLRGSACALFLLAGNAVPVAQAMAMGVSPPDALGPSGYMATAPLRYGGDLSGPLQGHLLLVLQLPDPAGHLQGRVLLSNTAGEPATSGSVTGSIRPGHVPGGAACTLNVRLADDHGAGRDFVLHGICSSTTLSGAITTRARQRGWSIRQIFWWDSGDTGGRYWLTRTGDTIQAMP